MKARLRASYLIYLAERLGEPLCLRQGEENYRVIRDEGLELDVTRSDFFHFARLFLWAPAELSEKETEARPDVYLADLGVVVAHGTDERGRRWEFAAKGGHNAEHHNHNDCGSFLLNIDGERFLSDIGAPEYVREFFSGAQRYTFLAARTLGHSLPIINGCEQEVGVEYAARILEVEMGKEMCRVVIELAGCYPAAALCESFVRTFLFEKASGRLTVTDVFAGRAELQIESGLISQIPIALEDGRAEIRGEKARLVVRPQEGATCDRVETHPYRTHDGGDGQVYRLVLAPAEAAVRVEMVTVFETGV